MHRYDERTQRIADAVFAYMRERLALDPVPLDHAIAPDELAALVPTLIDPAGNDPAHVLRLYSEVLAPVGDLVRQPALPRVHPGRTHQGVAAVRHDRVVRVDLRHLVDRVAGAVHAENQALRFLSDLAGLPAAAGGVFVQGGSAANLSALVVARERARSRRPGDPRAPLRFAVSDQTHSSVANTMRIIDVDPLVVPAVDDRLTGAALAAALDADADPSSVCAVVATAGTTNAGLVDDLAGVARVCESADLWMHVDAAYGGAALLAPSVRERFAGIEHADSLVIDPHKWLYAPFDCAALLYRDPAFARVVHTQDASYLDVIHEDAHGWNPSDYAYQLTRRARGLPLWFSLAVNGSDAYRDAIEHVLATARAAAAADHGAPPPRARARTGAVGRAVPPQRVGAKPTTRLGRRGCSSEQIAFVAPSRWHDEPVARLAFLHPETTLAIVDEILATTA